MLLLHRLYAQLVCPRERPREARARRRRLTRHPREKPVVRRILVVDLQRHEHAAA